MLIGSGRTNFFLDSGNWQMVSQLSSEGRLICPGGFYLKRALLLVVLKIPAMAMLFFLLKNYLPIPIKITPRFILIACFSSLRIQAPEEPPRLRTGPLTPNSLSSLRISLATRMILTQEYTTPRQSLQSHSFKSIIL